VSKLAVLLGAVALLADLIARSKVPGRGNPARIL